MTFDGTVAMLPSEGDSYSVTATGNCTKECDALPLLVQPLHPPHEVAP